MKRVLILSIILAFNSIGAFSQTYTMFGSATYTTCSGNFYDIGGPSGDYITGQDVTVTFYPADAINQKISMNFSSFSTYNEYDWLKVYNGSSTTAPQIAYLHGTVAPGSIISTASDGSLTFRFISSSGTTGKGWAASISCVAPLTIPPSGNIAMLSSGVYKTCSANFYDMGGPSGDYITGQDVTVTFYPADAINQKISVNFSSFSTYNEYDWLKVYNGSSTTAPQIAYLHGTVAPGSIISTASDGSLTFRFISSSGTTGKGWAASISCVAPLTIPPSGNIAMLSSGVYKTCSANFYDMGGPSGGYITGQDVTVTFYPADAINQKISVNFSSFSTYNEYDWLKVYNGSSTAAPQIAYLHGTVTPGSIISTASDGSLTFRFISSSGTTGTGWAASVSCVAPLTIPPSGNIAMLSSGVYKTCSANFYDMGGPSGDYITGQDVTVTFYPADATNQKISVNFSSFSTYNEYDWLKVYNGSSTTAPQIAYLHGTVAPGSIISTASDGSLTFRFISSSGATGRGWAASVSCTGKATNNISITSSQIPPWQREEDEYEGFVTVSTNPSGASWHLQIKVFDAGGKPLPTIDYPSIKTATQHFYSSDPLLKAASKEGRQLKYVAVPDGSQNGGIPAEGVTRIIEKKWERKNIWLNNDGTISLKIPIKYSLTNPAKYISIEREGNVAFNLIKLIPVSAKGIVNRNYVLLNTFHVGADGYCTINISNSNISTVLPGDFKATVYAGTVLKKVVETQYFDLTKFGKIFPDKLQSNKVIVIIGGIFNDIELSVKKLFDSYSDAIQPNSSLSFSLIAYLENKGFSTWYISQGNGNSVKRNGYDIGKALELIQYLNPSANEIDVICHSKGGLDFRAFLEGLNSSYANDNTVNYNSSALSGKIKRTLFLGTPHLGAPLANLLHLGSAVLNIPGAMDLKIGSPIIDELNANDVPANIVYANLAGYRTYIGTSTSNGVSGQPTHFFIPSDGIVDVIDNDFFYTKYHIKNTIKQLYQSSSSSLFPHFDEHQNKYLSEIDFPKLNCLSLDLPDNHHKILAFFTKSLPYTDNYPFPTCEKPDFSPIIISH